MIDNWLASKSEICSLDPSDLGSKVAYAIVTAYCYFGRYQDAGEILDFWDVSYGNNPWFQMGRALFLKGQGLFDDSIYCYDEIIDQNPGFIEAQWNRALTCFPLVERLRVGPPTISDGSGMSLKAQILPPILDNGTGSPVWMVSDYFFGESKGSATS